MRLVGSKDVSRVEQGAPELAPTKDSSRLPALDGLRGLAALAVMLYHLAIMFPTISNAHGVEGVHSPVGSPIWWLTSTPAHLVMAGPAAVLIFFVLSGLVVTLPVLKNPSFNWLSYFPQRAARLALPAIASVFLALLFVVIGNAFAGAPSGSMASNWSVPVFDLRYLVLSTDVLLGVPSVNNALWTLRYELLFSFMLPIFVVVALAAKRFWLVNIVLCAVVSVIGRLTGADGFMFMPIFMIGCVIAVHLSSMQAWVRDPLNASRVRWAGPILLAVSIFLVTLHASAWELFPGKGRIQEWAVYFEFLGAAGLVLVVALWNPLAKALSTRPFRWLGRISFSLYLIHMPLLVLVDKIIGPGYNLQKVIIVGVSAFLLAELFCRLVEQPLHRLSRRIGSYSTEVWQRTSARRPASSAVES